MEKVSGRIVTRLIGLLEPILITLYTVVWFYTGWFDPKNKKKWDHDGGITQEIAMIYVRNVFSVVMSFICAPLLIVATGDFMRVKWRVLACRAWCCIKVLTIGYWFYGLWRKHYELDASAIVPIVVMLIEMGIVYYYMINFMFAVITDDDNMTNIADESSTNLNHNENQSKI